MNIDKNNFSPLRVAQLIGREIKQQPRVYLMKILLLVGVLTLGLLIALLFNKNEIYLKDINKIEFSYFTLMIYVIGVIFTSMAFGDMKEKSSRIVQLMLPARCDEKYLARFIIYVPIFIVLYIVSCCFAHFVFVSIGSIFFKIDWLLYDLFIPAIHLNDFSIVMALFIGVQSFYWLGAILWPRYSLLKTYVAMMVLSMLYVLVIWGSEKVILGDDLYNVEWLSEIEFNECSVAWSIVAIVALVNYYIAYVRFKETDVVQRLL